MKDAALNSRFAEVVTAEEQFRAVIGHPGARVLRKHVAALDDHCRAFIARCPFVLIASADAEGNADVSPKGDPPGFVRVLDDGTLAVPDRPGNRVADTFSNLLQNTHVGLLFLIPGDQETLRVNGTAIIVRDQWLRHELAVSGKAPDFAIVVTVREVFFHCPKCMIRSDLWGSDCQAVRAGPSSLAYAIMDKENPDETPEQMQSLIDEYARNRLY